MDSLMFSINAVLPVFLMIYLGYFLKKVSLLDAGFSNTASRFVFVIALPLLLFTKVAAADFSELFELELIRMIGFVVAASLIVFILLLYLTKGRIEDRKRRSAFIQGTFRANYALLGIPLIYSISSDQGVLIASVLAAFIIPLYNTLAILVLNSHKKQGFLSTMAAITKNPLIIGIAAGLAASLIDLKLPVVLDKTIEMLALIAIPLALISIGVFFDFKGFKAQFKTTMLSVLIKTLLLPLLLTPAAYLLGIRGVYLAVVFVLFASPTAVSSYIMAKEMDSDHRFAGSMIILSTAVSVITIFAGIYILKILELI